MPSNFRTMKSYILMIDASLRTFIKGKPADWEIFQRKNANQLVRHWKWGIFVLDVRLLDVRHIFWKKI
jgi:hypothetical protein